MDAFNGRIISVRIYLLFLLKSLMKQSRAMVIDGAFGLGACMSSRNPSFVTASAVVGPKAAILISPCVNAGKFSVNAVKHIQTRWFRHQQIKILAVIVNYGAIEIKI